VELVPTPEEHPEKRTCWGRRTYQSCAGGFQVGEKKWVKSHHKKKGKKPQAKKTKRVWGGVIKKKVGE